ncbi:Ig-like domain-containing protein [Confluentibacter citreus]|uniref:Ig-like domain-containing protein n=1 Tax=Confluentibacter citreus TaxID=2007307 RepID=UPI000C28F101|nr:Ig-like domain-containing protein [Confluentibacter citreus]
MYLVFFCVLLFFNCKKTKEGNTALVLIETNNREYISFESTSALEDLSIVLENQPDIPILGDWSIEGDTITFIPILPFTVGQTYSIKNRGEAVYVFKIEPEDIHTTELIAMYPTTDSVPENLLKMYLVFSKPMQELGNSLDYITIYDNTSNKEVTVFLELQSELWNKDHNTLTLWLDPGRVKTDLIPNKELGLPIQKGHNYTITINSNWKDARGQPIDSAYTKTLSVGSRDNEKPNTANWLIKSPKKDTKELLNIDFNEAMDYFVAMEGFTILDSDKNNIVGTFSLANKEHELHFYPNQTWKSGTYTISVENRLEDLAGNNLNHLFDTDLKANDSIVQNINNTYMSFIIQ